MWCVWQQLVLWVQCWAFELVCNRIKRCLIFHVIIQSVHENFGLASLCLSNLSNLFMSIFQVIYLFQYRSWYWIQFSTGMYVYEDRHSRIIICVRLALRCTFKLCPVDLRRCLDNDLWNRFTFIFWMRWHRLICNGCQSDRLIRWENDWIVNSKCCWVKTNRTFEIPLLYISGEK